MAFESNITATNTAGSDATKVIWNYGSAPGLDPLGHVNAWLARTDTLMRSTYANTSGQGNASWQTNYDGCYVYWEYANIIEGTDPALAEDLRNLAKNTMDRMTEIWSGYDAGPTENPSVSISAGYLNYNGGMRTITDDPWFPAVDFDTYKQRTCNQTRGSSYSNRYGNGGILYSRVWGDDTWPNDRTLAPVLSDLWATNPPIRCREMALGAIGHIISDDWFADCEARVYEGIPWTAGHDDYVARVIEEWFLYPGGAFDQWSSIDEELRAANANWALVPRSWRNGVDGNGDEIGANYDYCPFMRAHSLRALIIHYYDDRMGTKDVKPRIVEEARKACDNWLEFWMRPTMNSNNRFCPVYEVQGPGTYVSQYGAPDLANFLFPVAAWTAMQTGDSKYYDLATTLVEAGNADGFWNPGKQGNQLTLWVYQGFQWLGWVADPFTIWWRDNP